MICKIWLWISFLEKCMWFFHEWNGNWRWNSKKYEGNPSLQTKVNVNPKNNERKFAKVACPKKPHFILK